MSDGVSKKLFHRLKDPVDLEFKEPDVFRGK